MGYVEGLAEAHWHHDYDVLLASATPKHRPVDFATRVAQLRSAVNRERVTSFSPFRGRCEQRRAKTRYSFVVRKVLNIGETVLVRLYDGREVEAKITAVVNGPAGQKVHVAFGAFALKVDPAQILRTVKDDS